jgi:hypothetical protein
VTAPEWWLGIYGLEPAEALVRAQLLVLEMTEGQAKAWESLLAAGATVTWLYAEPCRALLRVPAANRNQVLLHALHATRLWPAHGEPDTWMYEVQL